MTPDHTLAEHRRAFLTANHFDGPPRLIEWVRLGPLPIPIPNPPARRRALRLHDLHHLITGYATDWQGEWQISAWEVGGGLYRNPVAWMFCLMGMTAGMVVAPRLTLRAYARGRRGRTLLGQDPDAVDRLTLAEGRAFCGVDQPPPPVTAADIPRAIGWSLLGALVALLPPLAWALSRLDRAPTVFVPAPAARTPAPPTVTHLSSNAPRRRPDRTHPRPPAESSLPAIGSCHRFMPSVQRLTHLGVTADGLPPLPRTDIVASRHGVTS